MARISADSFGILVASVLFSCGDPQLRACTTVKLDSHGAHAEDPLALQSLDLGSLASDLIDA